jgi:hypothetical protein
MQIPIMADTTKEVASKYGVLLERAGIALRGLFIINPEGIIQQVILDVIAFHMASDDLSSLAGLSFTQRMISERPSKPPTSPDHHQRPAHRPQRRRDAAPAAGHPVPRQARGGGPPGCFPTFVLCLF